ncbi:MAG: flagellar FliJ family protein [Acidobacteriaceae bacterium]
MAFRFPLASVLRVRESIERREERALQAIQLDIARLEHHVGALQGATARARDICEEALRQSISAGQLHSLLCEEQSAERELRLTLAQLHTVEQQRDAQRKIYLAAHREREMLTEMRQKQKNLYEKMRSRDEQKKLDDLFIARRIRI